MSDPEAQPFRFEIGNTRNLWPIYLVGCHRSGTTLMRQILDTHARISCAPETKFVAALYEFLKYPQAMPALRSLGLTKDDIVRHLGDFVSTLMCQYAAKQGKPRWADKTPNYYRLLPFIHRMFDGKVLFLFLARHPFDTAISLDEMVGAFEPVGHAADPEISGVVARYGAGLHGWLQYWNEVYRLIGSFAVMHPETCLTLRYENLIDNPLKTCHEAFSFLGESFDSDLLERVFTQQHAPGYGDAKIRATSSIHRLSIDRWVNWSPEQIRHLWQGVRDTAVEFGYGSEPYSCISSVITPKPARHDHFKTGQP